MNSDAGSSPPSLPEEVWSNVFSFLFTRDLKSVRLTCRLFYNACDTSTIHAKEEFHFPDQVDLNIIKALINIERKVWSIKLDRVDSKNEPTLMFFQKHGANIGSLTLLLVHDNSHPESLAVLIELCESLTSCTIHFPSGYRSNIIFDEFEILHRKNVVRKNVVSVTLKEPYTRSWPILEYYNFPFIFAVFPNIKHLEITVIPIGGWRVYYDLFIDDRVLERETLEFNTPYIYDVLFKMRDQLEKLKLHFLCPIWEESSSAEFLHRIAEIEMKNLKELSINWTNLWDDSIANPFLRFNHLTAIKCYIGDTFPITKSAFVQLLLETRTELRYLDLKTNECLDMDIECFQALVKSRLTTLIIYIIYGSVSEIFHRDYIPLHKHESIAANFAQSSLDGSLLPNYTLKHFKGNVSANEMLLLLSTYFRCLNNSLR